MKNFEDDAAFLRPDDELWLRHLSLEARRVRTLPPLTAEQREECFRAALYPVEIHEADEAALWAQLDELARQVRHDSLDVLRWALLQVPTGVIDRSAEPRAAAAVLALRLDLLREAVTWVEAEVERRRGEFEEAVGMPRTQAPVRDADELHRRLTVWPAEHGLGLPGPTSSDSRRQPRHEAGEDLQAARPLLDALLPREGVNAWEAEALLTHLGLWALRTAPDREALVGVLRRNLRHLRGGASGQDEIEVGELRTDRRETSPYYEHPLLEAMLENEEPGPDEPGPLN